MAKTRHLVLVLLVFVLGFVAIRKLTHIGSTSRVVVNERVGVRLTIPASWEMDQQAGAAASSSSIAVFKTHPGKTALTSVQIKLMDGPYPDLRQAYDSEYATRDRALSRVSGERPPTFESLTLYGAPALRVSAVSALEEVRIFKKDAKTIMITRDVQGDVHDARHWDEAGQLIDRIQLL